MAWTATALAAPETTARDAGRPILIGANLCDGRRPIWSSDTGLYADTDRSAALAPAYLTCDRRASKQSYPGTADTPFYLVHDAFAAGSEFDCFALLNYESVGATFPVTLTIEIADNAAFTTNLTTLWTDVDPAARVVGLFTSRYTGSGYIRMRVGSAANFTPYVGEFWIGRRRQLWGRIKTGADRLGVTSTLAMSSAASSHQGASPMAIGRQDLPINMHVMDNNSSLQDGTSLSSWWTEIGHGHKPFLWCDEPSSGSGVLVSTDARILDIPREGFVQKTIEQRWRELPPYLAAGG